MHNRLQALRSSPLASIQRICVKRQVDMAANNESYTKIVQDVLTTKRI